MNERMERRTDRCEPQEECGGWGGGRPGDGAVGEGRTLTRGPAADPSTWLFPQQKQQALIDGINNIRPGRALGGLGQRHGPCSVPPGLRGGPCTADTPRTLHAGSLLPGSQ